MENTSIPNYLQYNQFIMKWSRANVHLGIVHIYTIIKLRAPVMLGLPIHFWPTCIQIFSAVSKNQIHQFLVDSINNDGKEDLVCMRVKRNSPVCPLSIVIFDSLGQKELTDSIGSNFWSPTSWWVTVSDDWLSRGTLTVF